MEGCLHVRWCVKEEIRDVVRREEASVAEIHCHLLTLRSLTIVLPLHTYRFLPFGLEVLLPLFMFGIQAFYACVFV